MGNAHLLGKVYFHRLTLPISVAISNLVTFGIQLSIFLVALAIYAFSGTAIHLNGTIFLVPLFLLMLAGYGLGEELLFLL